jgi:hypothetical protein
MIYPAQRYTTTVQVSLNRLVITPIEPHTSKVNVDSVGISSKEGRKEKKSGVEL